MSEQLRLRGDIASNVATYTGPSRETVVDTTNNRLVVQDGITPGGWPTAKLAEVSKVARAAINSSYSALASDRLIAVTGIVAPIYVTLPAAASFQLGARILIIDESGACSYSRSIVLTPQGSDVMAGAFASAIATPYGYLELESNGAGQWTFTDGILPGAASAAFANSGQAASSSPASFGGQAIIGLVQPVTAVSISDARIKATTRVVISALNPLAQSKGLLASINLTGTAAGKFDALAVVATLDGKIASSQTAVLHPPRIFYRRDHWATVRARCNDNRALTRRKPILQSRGAFMTNKILATLIVLGLAGTPALAQTYRDTGGTILPGMVPIIPGVGPISAANPGPTKQGSITALGYCQLLVTAAVQTSTCAGGIPAGATWAMICNEGAAARWRDDGAIVTASVGVPLGSGLPGAPVCFNYFANFSTLQWVAQSGTTALDFNFYK